MLTVVEKTKQAVRDALIVDASKGQLETVVRWLSREHLGELGGLSGFYCNRDIIRQAFRSSEMKCLVIGRRVVGFAIYRASATYGAIDILEIRPGFRRQGFGRELADGLVCMLFALDVPHIYVECAPVASEPFWRSLGFVDRCGSSPKGPNTKLVLRNEPGK